MTRGVCFNVFVVTQELLGYIREQMRSGVSKADVQKTLLAQGWDPKDLENAFYSAGEPWPASQISSVTSTVTIAQTPTQTPAIAPLAPLTVGKFKASFMIVRQSGALLWRDKEIMWFPIISGITSLIALVLFGAVVFFLILGGTLASVKSLGEVGTNTFFYALLFVYYFIMSFIVNFFLTGIYTIVHGRFNGEDLTFGDGMQGASANLRKIFLWSLIAATVGIVLQIIEDRFKWVGAIVARLLGAAWAILTYFSLPALVIGNKSVRDSFSQSASMIRRTWGETILINLGVGLFTGLLVFISILITVAVIVMVPSALVLFGMITLWVIFMVGLVIVSSALSAIFKMALYEYATTGRVPQGFSPELIQNAIKAK